jgi:hypothetical protein
LTRTARCLNLHLEDSKKDIKMRVTLNLDDQLARDLQDRAHRNRQSFKEVVNQALILGLRAMDEPPAKVRYRLAPASMGVPRPGIDLAHALALAGDLEDEAIAVKLELRK